MSTTPKGGWVFDLNVGETGEFKDADGKARVITLKSVSEEEDAVRGVIRNPRAVVDVDGEEAELTAALYTLPRIINGIKICCSATGGLAAKNGNSFSLDKEARVRCWNPGDHLFGDAPMAYPLAQHPFASQTQLGGERTYVDQGELPLNGDHIYYHCGVDIGGYDKGVPVFAPVSGTLICKGDEIIDGYYGIAGKERYDRIMIKDKDGWYYRFSHLHMIEPSLEVNAEVTEGDYVGVLGKEGASGGWAHLHFSVFSLQPSGRLGEIDPYPMVMEAYLAENPGALIACARPHRAAGPGEEIEVSGANSICEEGKIVKFEWVFDDGETAEGVTAKKKYDKTGCYSAMLTVTDNAGRTDIDFCVIHIVPQDADPASTPPTQHLSHYPSERVEPGTQIAFKIRTFFKEPFDMNRGGIEEWDFGDGTKAVSCSDGDFDERWHAYEKPGRFIVTVRRTGGNGISAITQIKINVNAE